MTADAEPLRILGLEPYDAGSHRAVRRSISRHSRHGWTWVTRPGRGWKWRMRLAAVELVDEAGLAGHLTEPIDVIFTTSLLGAADLRAVLPAALRGVPMVLYMHENQAGYPLSDHPKVDPARDVHFALTNLTSALAADLVIWNSDWNRRSFLEGMRRILKRANAVTPGDWLDRIDARSRVIWPPVEPPAGPAGRRVLHKPARVVWPHRWEHDKGPDELLRIARRDTERFDLRWTILGEQFPATPQPLVELQHELGDRIDHVGFEPDRDRYLRRLSECDWVLSTARHEFFGIAVVEALLAGCLPWLPQRLSYPEILPEAARGLSPQRPPDDPAAIVAQIREQLKPAVAPNAVARIDEAIETVIAKGR